MSCVCVKWRLLMWQFFECSTRSNRRHQRLPQTEPPLNIKPTENHSCTRQLARRPLARHFMRGLLCGNPGPCYRITLATRSRTLLRQRQRWTRSFHRKAGLPPTSSDWGLPWLSSSRARCLFAKNCSFGESRTRRSFYSHPALAMRKMPLPPSILIG